MKLFSKNSLTKDVLVSVMADVSLALWAITLQPGCHGNRLSHYQVTGYDVTDHPTRHTASVNTYTDLKSNIQNPNYRYLFNFKLI